MKNSTKNISYERDASLDSSKRDSIIVISAIIIIAIAWFLTNYLTRNAEFHQ